MNELPAAVISQRLRQGDRAAASISELRATLGQRSERELRERRGLIELLLSGLVAPRKVFLRVDVLDDPEKALQSLGIRECELVGSIGEIINRKREWGIRLGVALANSSARKLVLGSFLTTAMFVAFSQALGCNRTLEHLEVNLCLVAGTGTAWLSSILQNNSTLHTLILHEWPHSVLEPLAASLPINTTLRHLGLMDHSSGYSATEAQLLFFIALGRNRGLRSLALRSLAFCRHWNNLADALARHPTLVDVDLYFTSVFDLQIVVERGLLVSNNIVGLGLTVEIHHRNDFDQCRQLLARVMREKPIRRLWLRQYGLVDAPFLATLTTSSIVELKIDVAHTEPTWRALAEVVKRSSSLQNLHIISYFCEERTTSLLAIFAEALAVNQGLRKLLMDIYVRTATDTCLVRAVAKHPFLEEFDLKGIHCSVEELAEMVKTHPSLTTVGCQIKSVVEAQALIGAAKANRRLLKVTNHASFWDLNCGFWEELKACFHILHSYLEMNRHGRHKLLIEHPFLLADLMGSLIDFRTRINLVMENPEPLIQAIQDRRPGVVPQHT